MKKFTVSAIMAMGIITISGAAFAGTTNNAARGFICTEANDTVVPTDTVAPEQKEGSAGLSLALSNDTVAPADTVAPEQKQEPAFCVADTVVPADTVAPECGEPAK